MSLQPGTVMLSCALLIHSHNVCTHVPEWLSVSLTSHYDQLVATLHAGVCVCMCVCVVCVHVYVCVVGVWECG